MDKIELLLSLILEELKSFNEKIDRVIDQLETIDSDVTGLSLDMEFNKTTNIHNIDDIYDVLTEIEKDLYK
jgi:hypothetical protein